MTLSGDRPRVLVTRARAQSSALADHLRSLGAEPVLLPLIAISAPDSFASLDRVLESLDTFDWVVFTSANAVEATVRRATELGLDFAGGTSALRIAAIGAATAQVLGQSHLRCDLLAPRAISESLAEALVPFALRNGNRPARFFLPGAEDARAVLRDVLTQAGAEVVPAEAYRKTLPRQAVEDVHRLFATQHSAPEAIAFTSSSTVRNLFALLNTAGLCLPGRLARISIGPITSATLRQYGYPPHVEAAEATIASLAAAAVTRLRKFRD